MSVQAAPVTSSTIVVAVDVGKASALFMVSDAARHRLVGPVEFAMNCSGLTAATTRAMAAVPPSGQVKVGVEAAGHYHRPVLIIAGRWAGRYWNSILPTSPSSAECRAGGGSKQT